MSSSERLPQSNDTGRSRKQFGAPLAAVGALIVSVGFPAVVLFLVADDPTGLVLAFVWLFAFAFCGWFLATRPDVVRMREIMLAIGILAVLCLGVTQASAGEAPPPVVCVSAVGPVDANGHGDTTPVESGDCP